MMNISIESFELLQNEIISKQKLFHHVICKDAFLSKVVSRDGETGLFQLPLTAEQH